MDELLKKIKLLEDARKFIDSLREVDKAGLIITGDKVKNYEK